MSGHHDGADQLGEGAEASFGVGRHWLGFNRTHGRQTPNPSIDDDGYTDRRVYTRVSYPRRERPRAVLVTVHPGGPPRALHYPCQGAAVDRASGTHGPLR